MNKAVFLDRDGTINKEKQYLYKIEDFELLPGVVGALNLLIENNYLLIIITNQSGIARGYYAEKEYKELNEWMVEMFERKGIHVTDSYYCPHLVDADVPEYRLDCDCRKPKLGLYNRAVREHDIDLDASFAIGDKIRDCIICEVSSCHGFLIGQSEEKEIWDKVKRGEIERVRYCVDLAEAVRMIVTHPMRRTE